MLMEKGGEILGRSLQNSKEQVSWDELANNSCGCGTALSLPCDFVFQMFGSKFPFQVC